MGMMKDKALKVEEAQLPHPQWAVIVTGSKIYGQLGGIMCDEGTRFWVTWAEWGDTSSIIRDDDDSVPGTVKIFNSTSDAHDFAHSWLGHPWWCVPNGEYDVVEIKQKYKLVCDGWETV